MVDNGKLAICKKVVASCKCTDELDGNTYYLKMMTNNSMDTAIMCQYDSENNLLSTDELSDNNPIADYIDNMGHNYELNYINPDCREAFVRELIEGERDDYYKKPFKKLLNVELVEKVLNDVDSVLNDNAEKTEDDNSCYEEMFSAFNDLKNSFHKVLETMEQVKGSDCLITDEYPFEKSLDEVACDVDNWIDNITEANKEAGIIK